MSKNDNDFIWRSNTSCEAFLKNVEVLNNVLLKYFDRMNEISVVEDQLQGLSGPEHDKKLLEQLSIANIRKHEAEGIATIKLYSDIKSMIDSSILMACITLESNINCFCYYSLGEECTEAVEKLSMVEKMTVCHSFLMKENDKKFKTTPCYEAIYKLTQWRNKYAHGKFIESKSNDIKKNNLKEPEKIQSTYEHLQDFLKYIEYYKNTLKYMCEKDTNDVMGFSNLDVQIFDIADSIKENKDMDLIKNDPF